jgi:hypothetical protein
MDLVGVSFRRGVDLTRQRLPSGPDYVYLPDALSSVRRGLEAAESLPVSSARDRVLKLLHGYEADIRDGQAQLLLRRSWYRREPDVAELLFSTLILQPGIVT